MSALTQIGLFEGEDSQMLRPLRERQARAIENIRLAVKEGHRRIVVQAPTGFGKTLMAAHLVSSSIAKGNRPLFTCPAITLVNQTLKAFEDEGIRDIGVIQAQHERTDWTKQVQIASVQTLIRRPLPECDFVIIDECHQKFDKLYDRMASDEWKNKIVIGLSATPWAKGIGLHWSKIIIAATVRELIEEEFLSPFEIYVPATDADFSKLKVEKGEFTDASASALMGDKRIVADVVQTWLDKGENRPTFLFAVDRAHAQNLRDEFETKGVNCGYIDAFSTDDERRDTFRRFRSGRDKIISSVGCLTTGVDEDVRCIIDAAPTRSEIRHVQKIGRGLRMADGKENLRILDHAGNTLRLGMVTDIYHDHLDTRKPGEKGEAYSGDQPAPKPRKCHKCFALIPPGQRVCPKCGEKFLTASTVESVDGELVLLGSGKKAKKQEYTVEQKREWYAALLYLARKRGHKDGAAFHRFIKKFGHEPSGYAHIAKPPSPEIEKWDRSQTIRYLKGKQKAERSAPVEEYHAEF